MTTRRVMAQRATCAVGLILIAAASAWAGAPGYYVTELVGLIDGGSPAGNNSVPNAYPGNLLSNGTVVGETTGHVYGSPALPYYDLCSWSSSGSMTVYASGSTPLLFNAWGDDAGQMAVNAQGTVWVYSGGTYAKTGNANLSGTSPNGMSDGGLLFGYNDAATASWAYDLNTSAYYTVASGSTSWANGANPAGYVVGSTNGAGYVWQESNQSYSTIGGLESANGISNNSQLVAGETTGGQAAVSNRSGSQISAYWSGEATFVNDSGLVVGDTTSADYSTGYTGTAMAYFPNYGGQTVDLSAAYAPAGVTFNFAVGVNNAGQILVGSGYYNQDLTNGEAYLLTPALSGDANLDGKVDINDLTIVLAHYNQGGMSWSTGDFTGSGTVDINDLTIVLAHYGQGGGSSAGMAAVPEPASAALLAFCGLALLLCVARRWRG